MKEIYSNSFKNMPWKNGRGVTTEIYREDISGNMSFRLSRAIIDQDGSFSLYPGLSRFLVVLEGEGCDLRIDDQIHRIRTKEIIKFAGDKIVEAKLIADRVSDFNVFFDHQIYDCHVSWAGDKNVKAQEVTFLYSYRENKLVVLDINDEYQVTNDMISIEIKKAH